MDRSGLQRLIPIVLILIIMVVVIAALISLGRALFSGGDSQQQQPQVNVGQNALTNTGDNRSVRMHVRGPIVADEKFHSYTVIVGPNSRSITTFRGYLYEQVDGQVLPNNKHAYEQFVFALSQAGMMNGTPATGEANDTRGLCAVGSLFEFEVRQGDNTIQKLWTTSCTASKGTLKASAAAVRQLFQKQIPDFDKLTAKIRMNY